MQNPTLEAIRYSTGTLQIIDQLLLPRETRYIQINSVEDGWKAINNMQVRGAPAIAVVGCLSLADEILQREFTDKQSLSRYMEDKLNYLISARPTAVNMKTAAQKITALANTLTSDNICNVTEMKTKLMAFIEKMLDRDVKDNKSIGQYGAAYILSNLQMGLLANVLTHCNTGSLATAGYGTALGVIRSLHHMGRLERVYCTETRPYNQGARLTAYEMVHDKIPATLITDSMVAALMKSRQISAVVVGADRVAANGDTANKIGTYQIAITAKYHNVPFYIAAPFTSIDFNMPDGSKITIEERPEKEMTHVENIRVAAQGIHCWNPGFDVTPSELITAIITERGVFRPNELVEKNYDC